MFQIKSLPGPEALCPLSYGEASNVKQQENHFLLLTRNSQKSEYCMVVVSLMQ